MEKFNVESLDILEQKNSMLKLRNLALRASNIVGAIRLSVVAKLGYDVDFNILIASIAFACLFSVRFSRGSP